MNLEEQKRAMMEKWDNLNLYDCLLQEVFDLLEINLQAQRTILDLQNRVRRLEYMATPEQKIAADKVQSHLDALKDKS